MNIRPLQSRLGYGFSGVGEFSTERMIKEVFDKGFNFLALTSVEKM